MSAEEFDLKTLKIYFKVAEDVKGGSEVTCYYLKTYTLNKALAMLRAEKAQGRDVSEITKTVQEWFKEVEVLKNAMGELLSDKELCKQEYREFAYTLFKRCDDLYRDDNYSTQLAQDFFYTTVLFEGYSIFESPDPEMPKLRNNNSKIKIII
jgi:hypothetical protein